MLESSEMCVWSIWEGFGLLIPCTSSSMLVHLPWVCLGKRPRQEVHHGHPVQLLFSVISHLAGFRQFPSYAVLHLNCKRRSGPEAVHSKCCLPPFLDVVSNDLPKITYVVFCQAQSWPFHCIPLLLLWSRKPSTLTERQELLLQYHIIPDIVIVGNRNVFGIKLFLLGN